MLYLKFSYVVLVFYSILCLLTLSLTCLKVSLCENSGPQFVCLFVFVLYMDGVVVFQVNYLVPTRASLGLADTSSDFWTYRLNVLINGTAVKGSPFLVIVYPSVEVFFTADV